MDIMKELSSSRHPYHAYDGIHSVMKLGLTVYSENICISAYQIGNNWVKYLYYHYGRSENLLQISRKCQLFLTAIKEWM